MENSYNTVNHGVISFQPPLLSERKSEDRSTRGVDYYNRNGNLRLPLTFFFAIASPRDWSNLHLVLNIRNYVDSVKNCYNFIIL